VSFRLLEVRALKLQNLQLGGLREHKVLQVNQILWNYKASKV